MEVLSSRLRPFHIALLWGQHNFAQTPWTLQQGWRAWHPSLPTHKPPAVLPWRTAVASRCPGSCCLPPWAGVVPARGPEAQVRDALSGSDANLPPLPRVLDKVQCSFAPKKHFPVWHVSSCTLTPREGTVCRATCRAGLSVIWVSPSRCSSGTGPSAAPATAAAAWGLPLSLLKRAAPRGNRSGKTKAALALSKAERM